MASLKKLASQTALYGLSTIVGRFLNYLLVPIYTSIFVAEQYGIVTELYAYIGFLNVIYTFGMETAYFRFATKEKGQEQNSFNHAQTAILIVSLLFSAILLTASREIAIAAGYEANQNFIIWAALIIATDAIVAIPFARFRLQNKAAFFAFTKLSNIVLNIAFNIFFVYICPYVVKEVDFQDLRPLIGKFYDPSIGVGYVFLSNLLANLFTILILTPSLLRFKFDFNFEKLKPMLIYAMPILFTGMAGMINELLDRILLKFCLPDGFYPGQSNLTAVGIYGACYKLSIFMTLAIQAFRYAAEPFFFSQANEKDSPVLFAKVMKWFVIICLLIFLVVSLNLDILQYILGREEYRKGIMVVPVLLMANLFLGVYFNLSVWFKLTDKTIYGTYIAFGGAFLTIILNWLLIPMLGYMGCAITTLICYFCMTVFSYTMGSKYYPIPYPIVKIGIYITIAVLFAYIGLSYDSADDLSTSFIIHWVLIASFILTIFIFEKVIRRVPASHWD